jgi:hypothetical protein
LGTFKAGSCLEPEVLTVASPILLNYFAQAFLYDTPRDVVTWVPVCETPHPASCVRLRLAAAVGEWRQPELSQLRLCALRVRGKVQLGLFSPQLPEPGHLDVTLAKITAIVDEGNVGAAVLDGTRRPGDFHIEPFSITTAEPFSADTSSPFMSAPASAC